MSKINGGNETLSTGNREVGEGGKRMTIDSILLKLTPEETLRLTRILLDQDKEEALLFLKECLKPQLDQAGRGHMVRAFEER